MKAFSLFVFVTVLTWNQPSQATEFAKASGKLVRSPIGAQIEGTWLEVPPTCKPMAKAIGKPGAKFQVSIRKASFPSLAGCADGTYTVDFTDSSFCNTNEAPGPEIAPLLVKIDCHRDKEDKKPAKPDPEDEFCAKNPGAKYPADDGCNTCTCGGGCTEKFCGKKPPVQ